MSRPKSSQETESSASIGDLTERIGATLGLGKRVTSDLELAVAVAKGLPVKTITMLIRRGISEQELFRSVLSRRMYQRRLSENVRLTPEQSDRAERVARLFTLAQLVFGDDAGAARWVSTPKLRLGGSSPVALAQTGVGARAVEEILLQAYFGFTA